MAEMERGYPDDLTQRLKNWLREARDPVGSFPAGTDPEEWAVRRFVATWQAPVQDSLDDLEEILHRALKLCEQNASASQIRLEIESALAQIRESLREELGLQPWNE